MIGQTLASRYHIASEVGRGGMGVVYKARDTERNIDVAIKTIPPELAHHPEFLRRFQQEARALMRLHHPHVVGLIDLFEEKGSHYMVLEYVDGPSLSQLLARGPLPPERAREIASQVCDALTHAHEHNIVHRDIKPSNILLTKEGQVKVTDFGIARVLDATLGTLTGKVFGTARYASPEQVKGLKVDARSDLYSLGVVLYEMLTGRPPFLGSDDDVMDQHVRTKPVPPRDWRAEIPAGLEAIVLRCLEKDRESRYQTAQELADALRGHAVSEKAQVTAQVGAAKGVRVPIWALALIPLLLVLALGLLGSVLWPRLGGAEPAPTFSAGLGLEQVASPTAVTPLATEPTASETVPAEAGLSDRPSSASGPPDTPLPPTDTAAPPTPTPTGAGHIAFISERDGTREIYGMKADGSDVMRLTHGGAIGWSVSWSPDGTSIAFVSRREGNDEIYKMGADGSGVTRLTFDEGSEWCSTWSPDGNWIAFVSDRDGNNEIYKMRADGSEVIRLTFNEGFEWCPTWSPDGNWIAFESDRGRSCALYKMKADGSEVTCLTPGRVQEAYPSWSPDGKWIAFRSNREGNMEIYKMRADGSEVTRLTSNELYIGVQSWSPDGNWIVFESDRSPGRDLDIYKIRADGSEMTRLTYDEGYDGDPSWGP